MKSSAFSFSSFLLTSPLGNAHSRKFMRIPFAAEAVLIICAGALTHLICFVQASMDAQAIQ